MRAYLSTNHSTGDKKKYGTGQSPNNTLLNFGPYWFIWRMDEWAIQWPIQADVLQKDEPSPVIWEIPATNSWPKGTVVTLVQP